MNLSDVKRQELNQLFALNRKLFKAYLLKESLDRLWNYRYDATASNDTNARSRISRTRLPDAGARANASPRRRRLPGIFPRFWGNPLPPPLSGEDRGPLCCPATLARMLRDFGDRCPPFLMMVLSAVMAQYKRAIVETPIKRKRAMAENRFE
jgi:hypothetical protein